MSAITPIIVQHIEQQTDEQGNTRYVETGRYGTMIAKDILPVPDDQSASGMRYSTLCSVCWDDVRHPAISIHPPEELSWIDTPALFDNDEDEDEEENFEADDEEENEQVSNP